MSTRTLSGYRLGHIGLENDRDIELAARVSVLFSCPRGHEFDVMFSIDADLPTSWRCRRHGIESLQRVRTTPSPAKPARSHLSRLHERRTQAELDELLAGTLKAIRRQGGAQPGCVLLGGRPYAYRL
ncbi:RNA polymerase-binding protein RbpA [Amycolatopsis sp. NPDC059657]|uniref:RNA polymerase-binding protein RbpA n=1 Tax=Amycolatopsis sp. NPDC059657 TaxID=3346899 RepID=UPI00366E93DD